MLGQHQKLIGIASHFALILANKKAHFLFVFGLSVVIFKAVTKQ